MLIYSAKRPFETHNLKSHRSPWLFTGLRFLYCECLSVIIITSSGTFNVLESFGIFPLGIARRGWSASAQRNLIRYVDTYWRFVHFMSKWKIFFFFEGLFWIYLVWNLDLGLTLTKADLFSHFINVFYWFGSSWIAYDYTGGKNETKRWNYTEDTLQVECDQTEQASSWNENQSFRAEPILLQFCSCIPIST